VEYELDAPYWLGGGVWDSAETCSCASPRQGTGFTGTMGFGYPSALSYEITAAVMDANGLSYWDEQKPHQS
jgi:hypothetical protein